MTPDADPHPAADPGDDAVVTLLRETDWSLAVPPHLVDDVARQVERRRRRTVTAIAAGAVAAVIVVVAGVSVAAGWRSSELQTPTSVSTGSATPAPASTSGRVSVGSFSFAVPKGWILDPMSSSGSARFGTDGLQNDGTAPGPSDMPLELTSRRLYTPDRHGQVYLTVVAPRPTAPHPGPAPASDPSDRRAAVATIVRYGAGPGGAASVTRVPGLALGPATRYSTSSTDLVLLAVTTSPVVIQVESVNTSYPVLLALLRSGAVGG